MPEDTKQDNSNSAEATATPRKKAKLSGAKIIIYMLILLVGVFVGVFSSLLPFYEVTTVLQLKTGVYESHYVYFGFIGGKTEVKESVFKQLTDGVTDKAIPMSSEKHYFFGQPEIEHENLGYYASQLEGLWVYPDYDYKPQMLKYKDVIIKAFASGNQVAVNQISSTFTQDALGHQFNYDDN